MPTTERMVTRSMSRASLTVHSTQQATGPKRELDSGDDEPESRTINGKKSKIATRDSTSGFHVKTDTGYDVGYPANSIRCSNDPRGNPRDNESKPNDMTKGDVRTDTARVCSSFIRFNIRKPTGVAKGDAPTDTARTTTSNANNTHLNRQELAIPFVFSA